MKISKVAPFISMFCFLLPCASSGQKVLLFDEESGIQWSDKKSDKGKKFEIPEIKHRKKVIIVEEAPVRLPDHVKTTPLTAEILRETGIKFYFNGDYTEAQKYFDRAWSIKNDPIDRFWQGAVFRKLDQIDEMKILFSEILSKHPNSEVADDALFYLAVDDQTRGDYEAALLKYREVVEKYPDGTSMVGKFFFREEARKQLRAIQADLSSRLALLGIVDAPIGELLRQFQKKKELPVNGRADSLTVNTLILLSDEKEKNIRLGIAEKHGAGSTRRMYLSAVILLFLTNAFWSIRTAKAASEEINRVELLSKGVR